MTVSAKNVRSLESFKIQDINGVPKTVVCLERTELGSGRVKWSIAAYTERGHSLISIDDYTSEDAARRQFDIELNHETQRQAKLKGK